MMFHRQRKLSVFTDQFCCDIVRWKVQPQHCSCWQKRQEEDAPTSETIVLWLLSNTHLPSQGANWVSLEDSSQSSLLHLSLLLLQSTPNLSQRLNDPDCSERGTLTCRISRSVQPHSSWRRSDSGVQHQ